MSDTATGESRSEHRATELRTSNLNSILYGPALQAPVRFETEGPTRVAAIDLGTNSLHLLIGESVPHQRCRVKLSVKDTPRLGEGIIKSGVLREDAMNRTVRALRQYSWICRQLGVQQIRAVATAAVRAAKNGGAFVERVREETGVPLITISGEEEAELVARGVIDESTFDHGPFLIFNVGGGSTELVWGENRQIRGVTSLPVGAVTLTERYLRSDPTRSSQIKDLEKAIRNQLAEVPKSAFKGRPRLHGTGGAVTSVCGFREPFEFQTGKPAFRRVRAGRLKDSYRDLQQLDIRDRRRLLGIKTSRAEIIVAGAAIVACVMERTKVQELVVSRHGVKHGLILDELDRFR